MHSVRPLLPSAAQCRAARAMLDWSQADLARSAGVSRQTVATYECGASVPYPANLQAIRAALEKQGVLFLADDGDGPGLRLRLTVEGLAPRTDG